MEGQAASEEAACVPVHVLSHLARDVLSLFLNWHKYFTSEYCNTCPPIDRPGSTWNYRGLTSMGRGGGGGGAVVPSPVFPAMIENWKPKAE